ncbi:zf-TFIIB domain-containing protein [Corynebacterium glaucum]
MRAGIPATRCGNCGGTWID